MDRYQRQLQALGSQVFITIVTDKNESDVAVLVDKIISHIEKFERRFSRFLADSELTKFNNAAGQKTPVSLQFRKLLETSKFISLATNGIYNPFVLPALQQAGYVKSWDGQKALALNTVFTDRKIVPATEIKISKTWARIPENSAIDFGGIGKGYLLDELSMLLEKESLAGYWLSLGGDILCAGFDLHQQKWHIGVQSATDPQAILDEISNDNGDVLAIATSGITKRKGINNGQPWHHLIDSQTGKPAQTEILTATVTARQAVLADVYAKCIVIAGAKQAEKYNRLGIIQSYLLQLDRDNLSLSKLREAV